MDLEVGDVVMCTVERVAGTMVFVNIDGNGQASMVLSEVAPGRIRNLRDYVVPKKKIVCKIIRISPSGGIDVSLRRVTPKERKEVIEQIKQERSYVSVLKSVFGDGADEIIKKISEKEKLFDFLEEAKDDPKNLEKIVGKKDAEKILDILKTQKQKKVVLKKEIKLTSVEPDGVEAIKNLFKDLKDLDVIYISAGKYAVKIEDENLKSASNRFKEVVGELEKKSKKAGVEFSVIENKK